MSSLSIALRIPLVKRRRRRPGRLMLYAAWCGICLLQLGLNVIDFMHGRLEFAAFAVIFASFFVLFRALYRLHKRLWERGFPLRPIMRIEWLALALGLSGLPLSIVGAFA